MLGEQVCSHTQLRRGLPLSPATLGATHKGTWGQNADSGSSGLRWPCFATWLLSGSQEQEMGKLLFHLWFGENYLWGMFCVWKKVERNSEGKSRQKHVPYIGFFKPNECLYWEVSTRDASETSLVTSSAFPLLLALRFRKQNLAFQKALSPRIWTGIPKGHTQISWKRCQGSSDSPWGSNSTVTDWKKLKNQHQTVEEKHGACTSSIKADCPGQGSPSSAALGAGGREGGGTTGRPSLPDVWAWLWFTKQSPSVQNIRIASFSLQCR